MAKFAGYEVKVLVNGAHYATNGVTVEESVQDQNVTDSEGQPGATGGVGGLSATISGATNAAPSVVTFTTTPSPTLVIGQKVTLTGVTGATTLNGVHTITAVSGMTITLDNTVAPGGAGTAGTATFGGQVEIGTYASVGGPAKATITIKKPTWDSGQNPYFLTPFNFVVGAYDRVQIYPEGTGGPLYDFYSALCTRLSLDNDVNALEPFSVSYVNDCGYLTPSASA